MKKARILAGVILANGLWAVAAFAQPPAPPAAPAAAAAAADPNAAAAAKPTFCDRLDKACDKCRRKICATPLGGILNAITKPASIATGGIIPNFCPIKPSDDDLKKPGAEGAAAQAIKDAQEASARRKAVRILGTFDCHWYPEAELGLAAALRTDRAECVRLEAAIALNRGCCCTRLIVEALEDCVGGTDKLGPSENSPRVRAIAAMALDRCLCCPEAMAVVEEPVPVNDGKDLREEPRKLEEPGGAKPISPPMPLVPQGSPSFGPSAKGSGKPTRAQIEHARQTLAIARAQIEIKVEAAQPTIPSGQRSIAGLANFIFSGGQPKQQPQTTMPPAAPSGPVHAIARTTTQPDAKTPEAPRSIPASATNSDMPRVIPTTPPASNNPRSAAATGLSRTTPASTVTISDVTIPAYSQTAQPSASPYGTALVQAQPAKVEPKQAVAAPVNSEIKQRAIDPAILHCLETLRDAQDPEQRHSAIRTLANCDWHEHPEAISGLLYAARYDQHAGMRVASIRLLVSIKAATPEVDAALKTLSHDQDDWIRHEASQAIVSLQPSSASH